MDAPLVTRHVQHAVADAMKDTRVVAVLGARQVGKSTLLEQIASTERVAREIVTFDDQAVRAAAASDPAGFIAELNTPVAIDEVQRVPEVVTEIKLRVDRDKTPGQFVITGSANLLAMKKVKESLAGRAEYVRLHPFSQGELSAVRETFIPDLANGRFPAVFDAPAGRKAFIERIARGGFPEAQARSQNRRVRFFESYVDGVMDRDLATLGDVTDRALVRRLLGAVASISAQELNIEGLSQKIGAPATTLRRHVELLETLYLVRRIPAWSSNLLARSIKRPKIHITDTGLLAYLVGADDRRIAADAQLGGMFFESFVAMELERQISWLDDRPQMYHFRDRDQREVDIVLEHRDGSVTAVEVKSAATVHRSDFRGLALLRDKLGSSFKAGALLYTGASTVPFGDRLAAVPLSGLWS
ncbi:MAG: ATP-binding protein [Actinobacteria bacterium]|nr:ATP-binding protein [Actinomycetota bacterium]